MVQTVIAESQKKNAESQRAAAFGGGGFSGFVQRLHSAEFAVIITLTVLWFLSLSLVAAHPMFIGAFIVFFTVWLAELLAAGLRPDQAQLHNAVQTATDWTWLVQTRFPPLSMLIYMVMGIVVSLAAPPCCGGRSCIDASSEDASFSGKCSKADDCADSSDVCVDGKNVVDSCSGQNCKCYKSDGKDYRCTKDDECKSTATAATANSAATKGATCSKDGVCEAKAVAAKEDAVKAHFDSRTPASYGCPMEYASQTLYALFLISALSWLSTDLRKAPSLAGKMGELYTSLLQARNYAQLGAQLGAQSSDAPLPPSAAANVPEDRLRVREGDAPDLHVHHRRLRRHVDRVRPRRQVVVAELGFGLRRRRAEQRAEVGFRGDPHLAGARCRTPARNGGALRRRGGRARGYAGAVHAAGAAPLPAPAATATAADSVHASAVANAGCFDEPPERCAAGGRPPPQQGWPLALLQLAEHLAPMRRRRWRSCRAAPVPRSRAPAVVPTLSPTRTRRWPGGGGGVRRGLIAGCARNVARQLAATVEGNLEGLGAVFDDHRIAVYEEGSSDGTAARLAAWARRTGGARLPEAAGDGRAHRAARGVPQRVARRGEGAWVHGGAAQRAAGGAAAGAAATALSGTIFGAAHVGAEDEVPGAPADVRMDYLVMIDLDYTAPLPPPSLRHAVDVMASAAPPPGSALAAGGRLVAAGALEAAAGAAGARWGCSLATQRATTTISGRCARGRSASTTTAGAQTR